MLGWLLGTAHAGEDASALLARMDAAANQGKDAHLVLDVQVAGSDYGRTLEIWQKGDDRRLVRFTAPARLAGTGLLSLDDTVYLYLPAYGRARRVIGEQRGDAFLGTDFSLEDLSRLSWAEDFTASLEADEGDVLRLFLTPKDPAAHRDAALRVWMREADDLVARVEYLDAAGTVSRRLSLDDVRPEQGRPLAHRIVVEDLARQKRTTAVVTSASLDIGLTDAFFTLDELTHP